MALTAKPEYRGYTLPKSAKPDNRNNQPIITEQPVNRNGSDDREKPLNDALANVRKDAERYAERKNQKGK